jgi:DNA repair protein RecO
MIEDQAICVRTWDWSETSQTAVLLTKDHGMVRVLAKGSKRDRSAFSGGLELCTLGQMGAILRPNSDLALLTHWDLLEPMPGIRKNLLSYNTAMLGVDLIPRLIQDHDPHESVYAALARLLQLCNSEESRQITDLKNQVLSTLAWFQWTVLVAIGAMPVVDHDVLTGNKLTVADVYGFSAQLGGITQDPIIETRAHTDSTSVNAGDIWRVRSQTVEVMNSLGQYPSVEQFNSIPAQQTLRITRLLAAYIRERSGTDIPAMDWLSNLTFR